MSSQKSQNWSNLLQSDETTRTKENAGPSTWEKVAAGLGNGLSEFATDAIAAGTSEFVARVLQNNPGYNHEPAKDREQEPDKEKEKSKDQDLER